MADYRYRTMVADDAIQLAYVNPEGFYQPESPEESIDQVNFRANNAELVLDAAERLQSEPLSTEARNELEAKLQERSNRVLAAIKEKLLPAAEDEAGQVWCYELSGFFNHQKMLVSDGPAKGAARKCALNALGAALRLLRQRPVARLDDPAPQKDFLSPGYRAKTIREIERRSAVLQIV
ncbi:hypothetical protein MKEN_00935200 [Mycena kentingensis (nom. inval.)]|nr:hypothetical protein MKEN_00935200 [Mycena kentingensis (nom. inval.)]